MKRIILFLLTFSLLLTGCAITRKADPAPATEAVVTTAPPTTQPTEPARTIAPLPDTTMENLTDAILSVSLEEGKAYVDDTGKMQMDLKIYSYDMYDMVDIATLKEGDIIVRSLDEVKVASLERDAAGAVRINGGLDNGGLELVTDDSGVYYELGYNDHKNWHQVGEATIRVSVDFEFTDNCDPSMGTIIYYAGSFLTDEVTNYDFTPYNTTVRVENGQIIEMNRRYIP